jgi:hypothetical protein
MIQSSHGLVFGLCAARGCWHTITDLGRNFKSFDKVRRTVEGENGKIARM